MRDVQSGVLTVEDPAGVIDPAIGARGFGETPLGKECGMRLEGVRTRFFLERGLFGGTPFRVEIVFEGERLARVDLTVHMAGDEKGWDGWTQEGEQRRKAVGEAWAEQAFGRKMEAKPIVMEDGTEIVPFEKTWDLPRRIGFEGGEVVSYYDSKASFAGVVVRYSEKLETPN